VEEINVNQISAELLATQNLVDFEIDKDTWIYTYGSHQLQEVRSFGYECEERYHQERLKTEYPGFKINHRSTSQKLDFPPLYAIQESLKWHNAYVAKQIIDGEVIAIDHYLGKYQIIKKTHKPWYLIYKNLSDSNLSFYSTVLGCSLGLAIWATILMII
jgi:hypothetical protein